jgi:hypothetical protein
MKHCRRRGQFPTKASVYASRIVLEAYRSVEGSNESESILS